MKTAIQLAGIFVGTLMFAVQIVLLVFLLKPEVFRIGDPPAPPVSARQQGSDSTTTPSDSAATPGQFSAAGVDSSADETLSAEAVLRDSIRVLSAALDSAQAEILRLAGELKSTAVARDSLGSVHRVALASFMNTMSAEEAARILERMNDEEARSVLLKVNKRQAGKILSALPPDRAATMMR